MKFTALFFIFACFSCIAQDKTVALTFTNKAELTKWNTYQLPLGTNVTQQWYTVEKTNDMVVIIPTNAIPELVQKGRVTNSGGKLEPVNPKLAEEVKP